MFEKGEDVIITGQRFPYYLFLYLLTRFKEAFGHSSLSIEEAFHDLENFDLIIASTMDNDAIEQYNRLSHKEKSEITETLRQIIVYKGAYYGVFPDELTGDNKQFEELYNKHFFYFEPYIHYYIAFDENGCFDKRATFHKIDTLFINLPQRQTAYIKAYYMNRDHLDACDYAIDQKELSIADTIKINNIVNESDDDKVLGYKTANNVVVGAKFEPTDRKDVPLEMQKLFYEYKQDFGMTIFDPNEPGISAREKYNRTCDIFRKEANFHIRFIRIHPFNDGNGRTGRILLNHHLLSQGIAPVLLSNAMCDEYHRCINENDVEALAKLFFYSSSLQLENWVSFLKSHPKFHKKDIGGNNDEMAELDEFEEARETAEKKHRKIRLNHIFF
ncbi:MAG: Fic family protein [Bacilli bacterium]|nr:Fic family protein [Bacilli bacterium]